MRCSSRRPSGCAPPPAPEVLAARKCSESEHRTGLVPARGTGPAVPFGRAAPEQPSPASVGNVAPETSTGRFGRRSVGNDGYREFGYPVHGALGPNRFRPAGNVARRGWNGPPPERSGGGTSAGSEGARLGRAAPPQGPPGRLRSTPRPPPLEPLRGSFGGGCSLPVPRRAVLPTGDRCEAPAPGPVPPSGTVALPASPVDGSPSRELQGGVPRLRELPSGGLALQAVHPDLTVRLSSWVCQGTAGSALELSVDGSPSRSVSALSRKVRLPVELA